MVFTLLIPLHLGDRNASCPLRKARDRAPHRAHLTAVCGTQRRTVGSLQFTLSTQVPWTASAMDRILVSHACFPVDPTLPKSPTEDLWLSDQLQRLLPWGFPGHQLELPPGHLSPATLTRIPVLSCSLPLPGPSRAPRAPILRVSPLLSQIPFPGWESGPCQEKWGRRR